MAIRTPLLKSHEELYRAKAGSPEIVDVPPATFLMMDGHGDPNNSVAYAQAIQTLYSAAYAVKFAIKRAGGPDEKVPPLEGLWWGAEEQGFGPGTKDQWSWTMMIRLPESAGPELVAATLKEVAGKKPDLPIGRLRIERFDEGRCAQVLHVGPYSEEGPTVAALHAFLAGEGYVRRGRHHEIYLGDPRRAEPSRLRTLIRQPVA